RDRAGADRRGVRHGLAHRSADERVRGRLPREDRRRPDDRGPLPAVRRRLDRRRAADERDRRPAQPEAGLMLGGDDRTEKATPKQRDKARRKGQVARSADLNGAVVLLAAFGALTAFGPMMVERMRNVLAEGLIQLSQPDLVSAQGIGQLMTTAGLNVVAAFTPVALACLIAGVVASVAQVGFRGAPEALKPDPKRLNPVQGAKNIFGMNALV